MRRKKSLVSVVIWCFVVIYAGCAPQAERLVSENRREAIITATRILENPEAVKFRRGDIPYLIKALNSDNRVIAKAATVGLYSIGEISAEAVVTNLDSEEYRNNKILNRIETALEIVDSLNTPLFELPVFFKIVELYSTVDTAKAVDLLNAAMEYTNDITNEIDGMVYLSRIGGGFANFERERSVEIFGYIIEESGKLREQSARLDMVTNIAGELARFKRTGRETENESVYKRWSDLENLARSISANTMRPAAVGAIASGIAEFDISEAIRLGRAIFNGYNREYYFEVLSVANTVAKIAPSRAIELYDLARDMASGLRRAERDFALSEVALAVLPYDELRAMRIFDELPFEENLRVAFLHRLAIQSAKTDTQRAVYNSNLILYDVPREEVFGETAKNLAFTDLQDALALTNYVENPSAVFGGVAYALASYPAGLMEAEALGILDKIKRNTQDYFYYGVPVASLLSFTNIHTAKTIFNDAVKRIRNESSAKSITDDMEFLVNYLSMVDNFSTEDLWRQTYALTRSITNETERYNLVFYITRKLAYNDKQGASYIYDELSDLDISFIMEEWLSEDILIYEKETLAKIGATAIPYLVSALQRHSRLSQVSPLLDTLEYVIEFNRRNDMMREKILKAIREDNIFMPILSLFENRTLPLPMRRQALNILDGVDKNRVFKSFVRHLIDDNESGLDKYILDVLDGETYKPLISQEIERLVEKLNDRTAAPQLRRNSAMLIGYAGSDSGYQAVLNALRSQSDDTILEGAIEAAGRKGDTRAVPLLMRYINNARLHKSAFFALGKIGATDELRQAYFSTRYKHSAIEAVTIFAPERRRHKITAVIGHIHNETVYGLQIRGHNCVRFESIEQAQEGGATLFLTGEYEREFRDEAEYISTGGIYTVRGETHRLTVELLNEDKSSIWRNRASSYCGPFVDSLLRDQSDDYQQIIYNQANIWLNNDYRRRFEEAQYGLPFNFH